MPEDAQAIIKLQNELDKQEQALQRANPELFAQIKAVEEAKKNIDLMWSALKEKLIEAKDFDVHETEQGGFLCSYSVSKTSKIVPVDIDKVPEEFVEVKKVANPSKLKAYYELYGEVPAGCEDKSFYRLKKKITAKGVNNASEV